MYVTRFARRDFKHAPLQHKNFPPIIKKQSVCVYGGLQLLHL